MSRFEVDTDQVREAARRMSDLAAELEAAARSAGSALELLASGSSSPTLRGAAQRGCVPWRAGVADRGAAAGALSQVIEGAAVSYALVELAARQRLAPGPVVHP